MSEDEKTVLSLLKANSPIDLTQLKGQTGLSNKKWDKAIKGLTKNKLARVEKTDEGLLGFFCLLFVTDGLSQFRPE